MKSLTELSTFDENVADFLELSEWVGRDRRLVQGSGGNTSIKIGGVCWIKASGKWLSESMSQNIFCPVDRKSGEQLFSVDALRPSIELPIHLVIQDNIVVHYHSLNALSWLVLENSREALISIMEGLNWKWIGYRMPGWELAEEIGKNSGIQIFMLESHGVVVCGKTSCEVREVIERLELLLERNAEARETEDLPVTKPPIVPGWRLPCHAEVHKVALSQTGIALASNGALYPDHAVFLGDKALVVENGGTFSKAYSVFVSMYETTPKLAIFEGLGVLVRDDLGLASDEMLRCFCDLTERLEESDRPRPLGKTSVSDLLDWDAEKFRQKLDE